MTEMMQPQPGESIYDPTCGTGGMLLSCVNHIRTRRLEYRTLKLYGQELNLITSAIARMNLFLHGLDDFQIARGDTLSEPKFLEADRVRQFDVILANPPYSIKKWDRAKWESDPYGRNTLGTPSQGRADYAFLQHILASLKPKTGRCSILFPHGVLFRDEEQVMREKLVEADLIECVLGLGPNLFYGSPMEACILICRTQKPKERRNKVLFINAVNEVTRERSQSFLKADHLYRIVKVYREFQDVDGFCRVGTREEIRSNHANLNIPLYVRTGISSVGQESAEASLRQAIAEWRTSSKQLRLSLKDLMAILSSNELDSETRKK